MVVFNNILLNKLRGKTINKKTYKALLSLSFASTISSAYAMNSDDIEPKKNIRKLSLSQESKAFQDYYKSIEDYQKAADSGDINASLKLGQMYATEEGQEVIKYSRPLKMRFQKNSR